MVLPAVKDQILRDLDQLSPEQQRRAADLVHSLTTELARGTRGRGLLRFAGVLDEASALEMRSAIEAGCEQLDADGGVGTSSIPTS